MKKFGYTLALLLATPAFAFAATVDSSYLTSILDKAKLLINQAVPLLVALSVLYFIWGLFQLFTTDDTEKKAKAQHTIIYGIIALFVMVSIWGLVNLLSNITGISNTTAPTVTNQLP